MSAFGMLGSLELLSRKRCYSLEAYLYTLSNAGYKESGKAASMP